MYIRNEHTAASKFAFLLIDIGSCTDLHVENHDFDSFVHPLLTTWRLAILAFVV